MFRSVYVLCFIVLFYVLFHCVVLCIVPLCCSMCCFIVLVYVLFACKCVLYYCYRVSTQFQLTEYIIYYIIWYTDSSPIHFMFFPMAQLSLVSHGFLIISTPTENWTHVYMNLFTRNSSYYHLLKYLLFLLKHPVYIYIYIYI